MPQMPAPSLGPATGSAPMALLGSWPWPWPWPSLALALALACGVFDAVDALEDRAESAQPGQAGGEFHIVLGQLLWDGRLGRPRRLGGRLGPCIRVRGRVLGRHRRGGGRLAPLLGRPLLGPPLLGSGRRRRRLGPGGRLGGRRDGRVRERAGERVGGRHGCRGGRGFPRLRRTGSGTRRGGRGALGRGEGGRVARALGGCHCAVRRELRLPGAALHALALPVSALPLSRLPVNGAGQKRDHGRCGDNPCLDHLGNSTALARQIGSAIAKLRPLPSAALSRLIAAPLGARAGGTGASPPRPPAPGRSGS